MFQLITSGVALGLMSGAVGLHWLHLEVGTQEETTVRPQNPDTRGVGQVIPASMSWSDDSVIVSADPFRKEPPARTSEELEGTVAALTEIVAVLRELKEENRGLREQVGEANRDLTEMQFRLDTMHGSFRPLRIAEDLKKPESEDLHPLLPPKRR